MPVFPGQNINAHNAHMQSLWPSSSPSPRMLSGFNHHERHIGTGSRGTVERCADRAIKTFHEFNPKAIKHELNMCNDYLRATGSLTQEALLDGGKLNMP